MFDQNCVPYAPALIESMRSIGYSFASAVADLIDNSISAKAKRIDIISYPSNDPSLIILDDGNGMSKEKLVEAMRYGSKNPLETRAIDDLGRFGLGLKSASLSQCRRLTVVSKQGPSINAFSWDIDYVIASENWVIKGFSSEEIEAIPSIALLKEKEQGTFILLENFDRIKEGTSNIAETFNKNLVTMRDHLSLVFHRFIDDGLVINVNNLPIESRDPFLSSHHATQRKQTIPIYIDDEKVELKPFILPHLSKLEQSDLDKVGGKERLRNDQGFYVYRNKRLIIWGTWFGLERKDELNKLARVRVDIPNTLDYMWSIDIKKSTATLPDKIKKNLYAAICESIQSSEAVHKHRGRIEKNPNVDYIWEKMQCRDKVKYCINRDIPQIKMLAETMDDSQLKMLNNVISTLEESFPVGSIYYDAAKGKVEDEPDKDSPEEIEELWSKLQTEMEYVKNTGLNAKEYYVAFYRVEPYSKYEEIKKRIEKELKKYE